MVTPVAIATSYQGETFRSRLEAEWALNLDALGIAWVYEPEGFTLPSGANYLPDFWLPEINTWLEVKGFGVGREEKAEEFFGYVRHKPECRRHHGLILRKPTGEKIFIPERVIDMAHGPLVLPARYIDELRTVAVVDPECGPSAECDFWPEHDHGCCGFSRPYQDGVISRPGGWKFDDPHVVVYRCEDCGKFGLTRPPFEECRSCQSRRVKWMTRCEGDEYRGAGEHPSAPLAWKRLPQWMPR